MVVEFFEVVVGGCRLLLMVLGGFRWFWVVPCFSNYDFRTYKQHILYLASRRYEPVDTSGRAAVKAPEKKDLGHFVDFLNSLIRL